MTSTYYKIKTINGHKYVSRITEASLGPLDKVDQEILDILKKQKERSMKKVKV